MRKRSKIVMALVAILITAVILLIVARIGYFIYQDVTCPKLDKMIEYMEKKYGESFEVESMDKEVWSLYYTKIYLRSSKFPDEIITEITYLGNGKRIYKDDYETILRREEFNEAYQKVVSKVYKKSRVFVCDVKGGVTLPEEIGRDTPINDILSDSHVTTYINLFVEADAGKKVKQINELRVELKKRKWNTTVDIYYLRKGKLFNEEKFQETFTVKGGYYLHGYMKLFNNFKVKVLQWYSN